MSAKHYQVVDDIKVSEFQYVPLYRVANVDHENIKIKALNTRS
jgi:hypothetical protein